MLRKFKNTKKIGVNNKLKPSSSVFPNFNAVHTYFWFITQIEFMHFEILSAVPLLLLKTTTSSFKLKLAASQFSTAYSVYRFLM